MKFIAKKNAPDIPLEILEAQESDELVLFCGAGISYPSGLPGFSELVDEVYSALNESYNNLENAATKLFFFDRVLGLLEGRMKGNSNFVNNEVRRQIIKKLSLKEDADVSTHDALLQLAKTKKGNYRLVTTNVDHCFIKTGTVNLADIDVAPKLPISKPHRWESIVYLHGIIDKEKDPDGANIVFTSGDFGSAYLTERWASKFVTELFKHFTVLFVGYSVNDPVLRYMTDAISAEKRIGYKGFKQPYILAKHGKDSNLISWEAKGIKPILYSGNHDLMHETIKAWAAYSRDGLNGKQRIIKEKGIIKPLAPYEQDESVKQVIHTLLENANNVNSITGFPAKVFSELSDPPAPIEWLPLLDKYGLLSFSNHNEIVHSFSRNSYEVNLNQPDNRTIYLWRWLIEHHLDKNELINWIIKRGTSLHPQIKLLIKNRLNNQELSNVPYLKFWKIIISENQILSNYRLEGYQVISDLKLKVDTYSKSNLIKLLAPKFKIMSEFEILLGNQNTDDLPKDISMEVVIPLEEHIYNDLKTIKEYPGDFVDLLPKVSLLLNDALNYERELGNASEKHDMSFMNIQSISPTPEGQNRYVKNWSILIEICSDLLQEQYKTEDCISIAIVKLWKSFKYPTFRRLVFHAYTIGQKHPEEKVLDYLLEDDGLWLWSQYTKREKFRLLEAYWPKFNSRLKRRLLSEILTGPSKCFNVNKSNDEKWLKSKERRIWHLLTKLNAFGPSIPKYAQKKLNKISDKYPHWKLEKNQLDELAFTIHSNDIFDDTKEEITSDILFAMDIEKIIKRLEVTDVFGAHKIIDVFKEGIVEHINKVLDLLIYTNKNDIISGHIWHATLLKLSEYQYDKYPWIKFAELLISNNSDVFVNEQWVISWWIEKSSKSIELDSEEEQLYWLIVNRVLEYYEFKKIDNLNDNVFSDAINDPIGIIAESFFNLMSLYKLEKDEGFKEKLHLNFINRITLDSENKFVLAQVIFSSRLLYFHTIDPKWTINNLITSFDWDKSKTAKYFWIGFLWNIRMNADLALDMKENIIKTTQNINKLGTMKERFYNFFAFICIQFPELFTDEVKRNSIKLFGLSGLENISWFLSEKLEGVEEADKYWENRIKPFIDSVWQHSNDFKSEKISKNLSMMVINLNSNFVEALNNIEKLLIPIHDSSYFLNKIEQTDLPEKYTDDVFRLLSLIFSNEERWPDGTLRKLLDRLIKVNPELIESSRYEEMHSFLLSRSL